MSTMPIVPDARRGQVERRRRAEAAGADAEHLRVEQLRLPRFADLGQQEVAAVADLLLGGELPVLGDRQALVLPAAEAAAHRDDVRVAELLQDAPGEQRARAAGAVGDDRACALSGTFSSTRISRKPRGTETAPGM